MTGEVDKTIVFHWKLKEFSSLVNHVESPLFDFCGRRWGMDLFPRARNHSTQTTQPMRYMLLCILVIDSDPPIDVRYSVGIRTAKGGREVLESGTKTFDRPFYRRARVRVIERSELLRRRDELLPDDTLTLTLELKVKDGSSETVPKNASLQETAKSNVADASVPATIERNVADVSVQATVEERVAGGAKSEPSAKTGPEKIVDDVGKLWPNGDHTDVLLKVRDVEFKAHRTILAARTPVLGAMFLHGTTEATSGEVSIDDCEPEVFEQLLHYIYKGVPRELTAENASALYVLADKYLVNEVKTLCVRCMQDTLCLNTFCGTLTLSLMHREDELLKTATDFLSGNMIDVMESVQWQRFMREHPTWANEIQIRAMKLIQARFEKERRDFLDQSTL